jgi:RNA polymerase sigma-70 factor (ECF subfamily)
MMPRSAAAARGHFRQLSPRGLARSLSVRVCSRIMDVEADVRACLAAGEPGRAATLVIERFEPAIRGYLRTLAGEDDAEDVLATWQEDVWRGLPGFRGECSLRAWVYRLAFHASARFRRDPYRRRATRLPSSAGSRLAASTAPSGMAPGSRRERLARLRGMLEPHDQTLLGLRIDKEFEWDEIVAVLSADGLAVSAPALRKRFERLKERLARLAREEGLID